MRNKAVFCFYMVILLILAIPNMAAAETNSTNEGKSVYELQAVYSLPLSYVSDFGISMQGKYYSKDNFYLGWYTPIRVIFPLEQKHFWDSMDSVDYDVHIKLMGTAGYTIEKTFFNFDTSVLAGWRYWYTKSTVHNPIYNINGSYESSTTSFEVGLMSTIRWKCGKSFKLKNHLNNLNCDFYAYIPLTDDFFKGMFDTELALGLSYTF